MRYPLEFIERIPKYSFEDKRYQSLLAREVNTPEELISLISDIYTLCKTNSVPELFELQFYKIFNSIDHQYGLLGSKIIESPSQSDFELLVKLMQMDILLGTVSQKTKMPSPNLNQVLDLLIYTFDFPILEHLILMFSRISKQFSVSEENMKSIFSFVQNISKRKLVLELVRKNASEEEMLRNVDMLSMICIERLERIPGMTEQGIKYQNLVEEDSIRKIKTILAQTRNENRNSHLSLLVDLALLFQLKKYALNKDNAIIRTYAAIFCWEVKFEFKTFGTDQELLDIISWILSDLERSSEVSPLLGLILNLYSDDMNIFGRILFSKSKEEVNCLAIRLLNLFIASNSEKDPKQIHFPKVWNEFWGSFYKLSTASTQYRKDFKAQVQQFDYLVYDIIHTDKYIAQLQNLDLSFIYLYYININSSDTAKIYTYFDLFDIEFEKFMNSDSNANVQFLTVSLSSGCYYHWHKTIEDESESRIDYLLKKEIFDHLIIHLIDPNNLGKFQNHPRLFANGLKFFFLLKYKKNSGISEEELKQLERGLEIFCGFDVNYEDFLALPLLEIRENKLFESINPKIVQLLVSKYFQLIDHESTDKVFKFIEYQPDAFGMIGSRTIQTIIDDIIETKVIELNLKLDSLENSNLSLVSSELQSFIPNYISKIIYSIMNNLNVFLAKEEALDQERMKSVVKNIFLHPLFGLLPGYLLNNSTVASIIGKILNQKNIQEFILKDTLNYFSSCDQFYFDSIDLRVLALDYDFESFTRVSAQQKKSLIFKTASEQLFTRHSAEFAWRLRIFMNFCNLGDFEFLKEDLVNSKKLILGSCRFFMHTAALFVNGKSELKEQLEIFKFIKSAMKYFILIQREFDYIWEDQKFISDYYQNLIDVTQVIFKKYPNNHFVKICTLRLGLFKIAMAKIQTEDSEKTEYKIDASSNYPTELRDLQIQLISVMANPQTSHPEFKILLNAHAKVYKFLDNLDLELFYIIENELNYMKDIRPYADFINEFPTLRPRYHLIKPVLLNSFPLTATYTGYTYENQRDVMLESIRKELEKEGNLNDETAYQAKLAEKEVAQKRKEIFTKFKIKLFSECEWRFCYLKDILGSSIPEDLIAELNKRAKSIFDKLTGLTLQQRNKFKNPDVSKVVQKIAGVKPDDDNSDPYPKDMIVSLTLDASNFTDAFLTSKRINPDWNTLQDERVGFLFNSLVNFMRNAKKNDFKEEFKVLWKRYAHILIECCTQIGNRGETIEPKYFSYVKQIIQVVSRLFMSNYFDAKSCAGLVNMIEQGLVPLCQKSGDARTAVFDLIQILMQHAESQEFAKLVTIYTVLLANGVASAIPDALLLELEFKEKYKDKINSKFSIKLSEWEEVTSKFSLRNAESTFKMIQSFANVEFIVYTQNSFPQSADITFEFIEKNPLKLSFSPCDPFTALKASVDQDGRNMIFKTIEYIISYANKLQDEIASKEGGRSFCNSELLIQALLQVVFANIYIIPFVFFTPLPLDLVNLIKPGSNFAHKYLAELVKKKAGITFLDVFYSYILPFSSNSLWLYWSYMLNGYSKSFERIVVKRDYVTDNLKNVLQERSIQIILDIVNQISQVDELDYLSINALNILDFLLNQINKSLGFKYRFEIINSLFKTLKSTSIKFKKYRFKHFNTKSYFLCKPKLVGNPNYKKCLNTNLFTDFKGLCSLNYEDLNLKLEEYLYSSVSEIKPKEKSIENHFLSFLNNPSATFDNSKLKTKLLSLDPAEKFYSSQELQSTPKLSKSRDNLKALELELENYADILNDICCFFSNFSESSEPQLIKNIEKYIPKVQIEKPEKSETKSQLLLPNALLVPQGSKEIDDIVLSGFLSGRDVDNGSKTLRTGEDEERNLVKKASFDSQEGYIQEDTPKIKNRKYEHFLNHNYKNVEEFEKHIEINKANLKFVVESLLALQGTKIDSHNATITKSAFDEFFVDRSAFEKVSIAISLIEHTFIPLDKELKAYCDSVNDEFKDIRQDWWKYNRANMSPTKLHLLRKSQDPAPRVSTTMEDEKINFAVSKHEDLQFYFENHKFILEVPNYGDYNRLRTNFGENKPRTNSGYKAKIDEALKSSYDYIFSEDQLKLVLELLIHPESDLNLEILFTNYLNFLKFIDFALFAFNSYSHTENGFLGDSAELYRKFNRNKDQIMRAIYAVLNDMVAVTPLIDIQFLIQFNSEFLVEKKNAYGYLELQYESRTLFDLYLLSAINCPGFENLKTKVADLLNKVIKEQSNDPSFLNFSLRSVACVYRNPSELATFLKGLDLPLGYYIGNLELLSSFIYTRLHNLADKVRNCIINLMQPDLVIEKVDLNGILKSISADEIKVISILINNLVSEGMTIILNLNAYNNAGDDQRADDVSEEQYSKAVQSWNNLYSSMQVEQIAADVAALFDIVDQISTLKLMREESAVLKAFFDFNSSVGMIFCIKELIERETHTKNAITYAHSILNSEISNQKLLNSFLISTFKYIRYLTIFEELPYNIHHTIMLDCFPWLYSIENKRDFLISKIKRESTTPRGNKVRVNRQNLIPTLLNEIAKIDDLSLTRELRIEFIGEYGIDQGGLKADLYTLAFKELFDPRVGLFRPCSDESILEINPNSWMIPNHIKLFELAGTLIGKALLEKIPIGVSLAKHLVKSLIDQPLSLQDLEFVDKEYYKSLLYLLDAEPHQLNLTYTFITTDFYGKKIEIDMIENGSRTPVTNENKLHYIKATCEMRLVEEIPEQLEAFVAGFRKVMPVKILNLFRAVDLQTMIYGNPTIYLDDMLANCKFDLIDVEPSNWIQFSWLYEIMKEFSQEKLAAFLQFTTGMTRPPVDGFKNKPITVKQSKADTRTLPIAHTCFGIIEIPDYDSKEVMKQKLEFAIYSGKDEYTLL